MDFITLHPTDIIHTWTFTRLTFPIKSLFICSFRTSMVFNTLSRPKRLTQLKRNLIFSNKKVKFREVGSRGFSHREIMLRCGGTYSYKKSDRHLSPVPRLKSLIRVDLTSLQIIEMES